MMKTEKKISRNKRAAFNRVMESIQPFLLKRAQKGTLPLVDAVKKLQAELLSPPALGGTEDDDAKLVANAKKMALFTLGIAFQKCLNALEEQQEVVAGITDVAMNAL